ncbi:MAG TPA: DUF3108 domain-containing protein [Candidatus Acidoferrales bacterium]|nr:DUF3108 domain-containing protein [Candidatus Acidoferrales bacterium]
MDVRRKAACKKAVWISAVGVFALMVSALALNSVYAINFFNLVTKNLQSAGWNSTDSSSVMQVNEEMTFEAGYLFFKIGSVKFQVLGNGEYDSVSVYRLRAYIDSYSGVPFVNFHAVYDTYADAKTLFCLFNLRTQKDGDIRVNTTTNFQLDRKKIEWAQSRGDKLIKEIDMQMDTSYTNGVSFIYFLRNVCRRANGEEMKLDVPIIDDTVRSTVSLTINERREPCDVTAFDFPLDSYRLSGRVNFTGTFGISGDVVGWMVADSSALPLKANVKVLIGSVVVQLKEVKRDNWTPPRSTSSE